MADTQRTRQQLLALFADNVTGQISAQDFRDGVVTWMEEEFANPGDFWKQPDVRYTTTDKDARGHLLYSQYVGSDCSWMNIMYLNQSDGYWYRANVANSLMNKGHLLGIAMNSYTSDVSTAQILLEGMIYDSTFSTVFSEKLGQPVFLDSGLPGSISTGAATLGSVVVGYVAHSEAGDSAVGKWYFRPECWGTALGT